MTLPVLSPTHELLLLRTVQDEQEAAMIAADLDRDPVLVRAVERLRAREPWETWDPLAELGRLEIVVRGAG